MTNNDIYNYSKDDMLLKTNLNQFPKCIIGPLYCLGGVYGICKVIINEIKYKHIRYIYSYKLKISYILNNITSNMIKYSNHTAGFGVMYYFTTKFLNYFIKDQLYKLSNIHRNAIYGFTAGALFKSTRGLVPSLLGGFVFSNCCMGITYIYNIHNKRYNKYNI